ncbi:permease [Paenibacillus sp. MWE-103]|uniref:Permease n=1 Tax=Paenibacillus artemisiicola TaxID=1172618 RepID=A0ABS3WBP1_9BACL|nr:permease [Paenibacillus artemisiicola]MBO7745716.1 permease [Paenibacillus artemisiicola]
MDAETSGPRSSRRVNLAFGFLFGFLLVLFLKPELLRGWRVPDWAGLNAFKTMFVGIVLEALPFILLSVFVSSLMHVFLPEGWIRRAIPRHPLLGIAAACLLGAVFPVCECGLIPIVRRLIAKGMPLYAGTAFILVGPIVNPIVYGATHAAFRTRPEMLAGRMGLALTVGLAAGLFVYFFVRGDQLRGGSPAASAPVPGPASARPQVHAHDHHHDRSQPAPHHSAHQKHPAHRTHHRDHSQGASRGHGHGNGNKFFAVLHHAGGELFGMGGYLIFGAAVAAAAQAFLPRAELAGIGQSGAGAHMFMMAFGFVLSLCSTSDAFVASSFAGTFPAGALIAMLVFGPMMNVKGTLMLLTAFRARFVLLLTLLVFGLTLAGSLLFARLSGLA